jgi:cyclic beta-1,2-glucan synthetase
MLDSAFTGPGSLARGGELLSIEMLEEHARRLAALFSIARRRGSGRAHLRRLKAHMHALRDVYTSLSEDARHEAMSPAAEWLLDNFHIVSAVAHDIHHDLPPSFFRRLPRIATDEFAGFPRIYALALELIGSSAGRLEAQRLQRFIGAFQSVTPLTMGELWAWPSALKLASSTWHWQRGIRRSKTRFERKDSTRRRNRPAWPT